MTSLERLEAYKGTVARKAKPKAAELWTPPTREMLPRTANVIAADPSLAAFGLVHLVVVDHRLVVGAALKLATPPLDGMRGNLDRHDQLRDMISEVVGAFLFNVDLPLFGVHETPPAAGPRIRRPESAILGSAAFRSALAFHGVTLLPPMEPRTHAKLFTGNANANKVERGKAFPGVADGLGLNTGLLTNEAKRDAASVGVAALIRDAEEYF
jgi:hypothetical protein